MRSRKFQQMFKRTVITHPISDGGAFGGAMSWVSNLLLGELGWVLAVLAIAGVGLAMLRGYIVARQSFHAVLGAFILFGAPGIAVLLTSMSGNATDHRDRQVDIPMSSALADFGAPDAPSQTSNPYTRASVPYRGERIRPER